MADYESNIILIIIVIFKMADYKSNIILIIIIIFKMADYESNIIIIVIFNPRWRIINLAFLKRRDRSLNVIIILYR